MIGKIAGVLEYRSTDHILVDVRGVGYIVYVSNRVLAGLPGNGEAVALYTDLLVREDNLQLFGFTTLVEKEWHRLLMSVQGRSLHWAIWAMPRVRRQVLWPRLRGPILMQIPRR